MNSRISLLSLLLCVSLVAISCSKSSAFNQSPEYAASATQVVVKVAVLKNGDVSADGKYVSVEQLDIVFSNLATKRGAVWYYRESGKDGPHPNAIKVMELIIKHRLPVRLSSKPDYSDSVTS
ncbi:MAG: hypothetical protein ACHQ5A_03735 [Opitutales bacterium]